MKRWWKGKSTQVFALDFNSMSESYAISQYILHVKYILGIYILFIVHIIWTGKSIAVKLDFKSQRLIFLILVMRIIEKYLHVIYQLYNILWSLWKYMYKDVECWISINLNIPTPVAI